MRERMVTRTITTTNLTVMAVNMLTMSIEQKTYSVACELTADNALTWARDNIESDTVKVASVVNVETVTMLYGMTEADFIRNASILPNR